MSRIASEHKWPLLRKRDSTGAGDTFIAGMLFGLLCRQDWRLEKQLSFANELAGRKVGKKGSQV
ncbi:hypothetical protein MMC17_007517 [Xylographa soralifera]|nr:hypothetical protein [Xylographa soralifera]